MQDYKDILEKAYNQGWLSGSDFSVLIHKNDNFRRWICA